MTQIWSSQVVSECRLPLGCHSQVPLTFIVPFCQNWEFLIVCGMFVVCSLFPTGNVSSLVIPLLTAQHPTLPYQIHSPQPFPIPPCTNRANTQLLSSRSAGVLYVGYHDIRTKSHAGCPRCFLPSRVLVCPDFCSCIQGVKGK
ncbi:hypothetical protein L873DRAFT_699111 [Choiromyces venosus 120613-1]|uniref:Uncharacterized protein n=1 Tax=Choiromyces venosus 120613-1 TaxID=1336337 RepID=A0A3N4JSC0_9PEZI|nr:hypothetical protein L873DRAFT_699111 [Choiromyces venosus 120613-1]